MADLSQSYENNGNTCAKPFSCIIINFRRIISHTLHVHVFQVGLVLKHTYTT